MATKRPWNRAKIFQPFDALPGLRELLREKEIEHEVRFDAEGNDVGIQHEQETGIDDDCMMESKDSTAKAWLKRHPQKQEDSIS